MIEHITNNWEAYVGGLLVVAWRMSLWAANRDTEPACRMTEEQIARMLADGWEVKSQVGSTYQLTRGGEDTSHLFHLVMCFITFGLWIIVWLLVSVGHTSQNRTVIKM